MTIKTASIQKKCVECSAVFFKKTNNQILCGNRCRLNRRKKLERPKVWEKLGYEGYREKQCKICSSIFKPRTSNHRSCSEACSLISKRRYANEAQKKRHKRLSSDLNYSMQRKLYHFLYRMIKNKKRRTNEYFDFSPSELADHIESKFTDGMSWDNYGEWHIDHIIPLCSFSFYLPNGEEDVEQIRLASRLENLQPLWARENMKKSARMDYAV